MGWWNKKNETDCRQALALHDPRTRVNTTSAATETTNTAVQSSTITDSNKHTITFLSTRKTVTHSQRAIVTETTTRRTPSQAELEALFAQMRMGGEVGSGTTTLNTMATSSRSRPPSLNGVSFRSTQPFKATTSNVSKRSSTLIKTEHTTVTKKDGRNFSQHLETHRVDLKGKSKTAWAPFSSSPGSSASSNVSPYAQKSNLAINYILPCAKASNAIAPSLSSSQVSSLTSAKPAKMTLIPTGEHKPKPFVSLPSTICTKSTGPGTSFDAQCSQSPFSVAEGAAANSNQAKSKMKPARVYIFNNERFDTKNEFRAGSAQDVKALCSSFEQLKCKVEVITDATLATLKKTVRMLETKDFLDKSALVLVVLSHGTRYDRLAAKDDDYSLDDDVLFPILRNRTLKDKPKLLFVQACKGANELGGFMTDAIQPNGSPNEILKCYSTYEGYVSFRREDGTPFIQTLCEALNRSGRTSDIDAIMMNVRRVVKTQTKDGQIPSVTSTLTSKYVFGNYM
ncbi:hypothetical protein KR009_011630 [Drosophila setifemur]|nr:hypothetical protein KR009_011630 [Drosophila setifemur]